MRKGNNNPPAKSEKTPNPDFRTPIASRSCSNTTFARTLNCLIPRGHRSTDDSSTTMRKQVKQHRAYSLSYVGNECNDDDRLAPTQQSPLKPKKAVTQVLMAPYPAPIAMQALRADLMARDPYGGCSGATLPPSQAQYTMSLNHRQIAQYTMSLNHRQIAAPPFRRPSSRTTGVIFRQHHKGDEPFTSPQV